MTKTFKFGVSTQHVGSAVEEDVKVSFPDSASQEEIDKTVDKVFLKWVHGQLYTYWVEIE